MLFCCAFYVGCCAVFVLVLSRCLFFVKTLIERQNNVAEMAATRQVQEKFKQRQMAAAAALEVRLL